MSHSACITGGTLNNTTLPILAVCQKAPRPTPSVTDSLKRQPVTYSLSRGTHVLHRTKIFGYVAKISLCCVPYVAGYVMGMGQGSCYKPIVLARAHDCLDTLSHPHLIYIFPRRGGGTTALRTSHHAMPALCRTVRWLPPSNAFRLQICACVADDITP